MKYIHVLAVGVLAVAGCHGSEMAMDDPPELANPAPGKAAVPYTRLSVSFGTLNKTTFEVDCPFDTLKSLLTTQENVQLNVQQEPPLVDPGDPARWKYDYHVVFSPRSTLQKLAAHNSEPGVDLGGPADAGDPVDAWGYYWGLHPVGGTKRVQMMGQGTEYYVFVRAGDDIIANVSADPAHRLKVTPKRGGPGNVFTLSRGQSARVDDAGNVIGPQAFDRDPELEQLVRGAEKTLKTEFDLTPPKFP